MLSPSAKFFLNRWIVSQSYKQNVVGCLMQFVRLANCLLRGFTSKRHNVGLGSPVWQGLARRHTPHYARRIWQRQLPDNRHWSNDWLTVCWRPISRLTTRTSNQLAAWSGGRQRQCVDVSVKIHRDCLGWAPAQRGLGGWLHDFDALAISNRQFLQNDDAYTFWHLTFLGQVDFINSYDILALW